MNIAATFLASGLALATAAGDAALPAPGPHATGFRIEAITDAPRPLELHIWYPAEACSAPMTLGDYVDAERGEGDPAMEQIRDTPMRACRDATPAAGPHPVLIGRQSAGTWALQSEHFASHGYLVVMVVSRGSRISGTPDERARLVAAEYERMAREMDTALTYVLARKGDGSRVGVLGAGIAPMLFAMQSDRVRAVSMQDSGFFRDGPTADALRHAASWQPSRLSAPLLYLVTADEAARENRLADFDAMPSPIRLRAVLDLPPPAAHDDLATSGYLLRARTAPGDLRQGAFARTLAALRTFFDAFVRDDARARAEVESGALLRALGTRQ